MLEWLLAFSSTLSSFQQPILPIWALIGGSANKHNWGLLPGKISCPVLPLRLHTDWSYLLMKVAGFTAWTNRCKGCPRRNHYLIHNFSLAHRNVIWAQHNAGFYKNTSWSTFQNFPELCSVSDLLKLEYVCWLKQFFFCDTASCIHMQRFQPNNTLFFFCGLGLATTCASCYNMFYLLITLSRTDLHTFNQLSSEVSSQRDSLWTNNIKSHMFRWGLFK